MHRFFVEPKGIDGGKALIIGDDVKHISNVLRLKRGDKITVCDGRCTDYLCEISSVEKTSVCADIIEKTPSAGEVGPRITLYQGIPKGDKLDYIVQKCVELGAVRIVPTVMKRTVAKVKAPCAKTARWRRIALEAAKQCGRGIIPEVSEPMDFCSAIAEVHSSGALNILPYECETERTLSEVLDKNPHSENVNIIIGPEGGFDDDETALARSKDIHTVTLGGRIMRCDTAPVAVVAAVMYALGGWRRQP